MSDWAETAFFGQLWPLISRPLLASQKKNLWCNTWAPWVIPWATSIQNFSFALYQPFPSSFAPSLKVTLFSRWYPIRVNFRMWDDYSDYNGFGSLIQWLCSLRNYRKISLRIYYVSHPVRVKLHYANPPVCKYPLGQSYICRGSN